MTWSSISPSLIECALSELHLALNDRSRKVLRISDNHYSPHSLGSIALLVTAFDAWLNELITTHSIVDHKIKSLINAPTIIKYNKILKYAQSATLEAKTELNYILDIRDEIIHHLPRKIPLWFKELDNMDLFIRSPIRLSHITLADSLQSYKLAYWVWKEIDEAVVRLSNALNERFKMSCGTALNFGVYKTVYSPEKLSSYDKTNNLKAISSQGQFVRQSKPVLR